MLRENKYRVGIDETPLTPEEYERLKNGGSLYDRVTAEKRPIDEIYKDNEPLMAV